MSVKIEEDGASAAPQQSQLGQVLAGNAQQATTAAPAANKTQQFKGAPMQQQYSSLTSSLLGSNPAPLSSNPEAEAIKNLTEAIKELTPKIGGNYTLTSVPMSRMDGGQKMFYSALILVLQYADPKAVGLSYHTLLLADTNGEIPSAQQGFEGKTMEIQRTPSDVYDDLFRAAVRSAVRGAFPNIPNEAIYDAESEVLPKGYDFKNGDLVRRTVVNALRAAGTILNVNTPGYEHLSLGNNASNLNTQAKLMFNQATRTDAVGNPVRADVRIEFSEVLGNEQVRPGEIASLNTGESSVKAFALSGFTDLVFSPAPGVMPVSSFAQAITPQAGQPQYLYTPRFVITEMDAEVLNTIPGTLLGLTTVLTMYENANWMGSFKRDPGAVLARDEFDPRDIGAIGIEVNGLSQPGGVGARYETRTDAFNDTTLAMMLRAYVRPNLVISMDVPETGPDTWLGAPFLAAAEGSAQADREIRAAADILTGGHFSQIMPAGVPIVIPDNNRIHLGSYIDNRTKTLRDIRDVDYLTVLNMFGENDPQHAREFSDSYTRNEYNLDVRLNHRRKVIDACVGASAKYTGWARRITFTGEGLMALAKAVAACKLTIRSVTPFQDMSGQPRAGAGWLDQVALNGGGGNLFQGRTYGGGGNSYNTGRSFGSRFGNR